MEYTDGGAPGSLRNIEEILLYVPGLMIGETITEPGSLTAVEIMGTKTIEDRW